MENHAWNLAPPALPDGALAGDSGREGPVRREPRLSTARRNLWRLRSELMC
jgi:hypothetical protein